jgi:hypothetical protein
MDLATLHTVVRDAVRRGSAAELHSQHDDAIARLSAAEQAALRTWQRRLQIVDNDLTRLAPLTNTVYWW